MQIIDQMFIMNENVNGYAIIFHDMIFVRLAYNAAVPCSFTKSRRPFILIYVI